MKLVIGNDHSGVEMKNSIKAHIRSKGIEVTDIGTHSVEPFDYPIIAFQAGKMIADGKADAAILICGTGMGVSIAANKMPGIRAGVCSEPYSAHMAKAHNNANVLALGARVIGADMAFMIVDAWLNAEYNGERHKRRMDMITKIESTGVLVYEES